MPEELCAFLRHEPQLTLPPPTTIDCARHTQLVLTASVEALCVPDTMSGAGDNVNSTINLDLEGALGMYALLLYHDMWEVLRGTQLGKGQCRENNGKKTREPPSKMAQVFRSYGVRELLTCMIKRLRA